MRDRFCCGCFFRELRLSIAVARKLKSVAFPLVGCGIFGLEEKMLILQFLEAIEGLNDRLGDAEERHVYLVIRNRTQFELAAGTFLDLVMQARSKMGSV